MAPKASFPAANSSPWDPVSSNGGGRVVAPGSGVDDEFDLLSNRSKSPTGASSLSFDLAGGLSFVCLHYWRCEFECQHYWRCEFVECILDCVILVSYSFSYVVNS